MEDPKGTSKLISYVYFLQLVYHIVFRELFIMDNVIKGVLSFLFL